MAQAIYLCLMFRTLLQKECKVWLLYNLDDSRLKDKTKDPLRLIGRYRLLLAYLHLLVKALVFYGGELDNAAVIARSEPSQPHQTMLQCETKLTSCCKRAVNYTMLCSRPRVLVAFKLFISQNETMPV